MPGMYKKKKKKSTGYSTGGAIPKGYKKGGAIKKVKKVKPITVKGVSMVGLTKRQQETMKKHGKHHTAKHLRAMVLAMKKGETFTQSHKTAMKKAGR